MTHVGEKPTGLVAHSCVRAALTRWLSDTPRELTLAGESGSIFTVIFTVIQ